MTLEQHLATLEPSFAKLIAELMQAVEKRGHSLMITQSLRTFEEQNKLYAQGRAAPGKKVTNAKGGESLHNYGLAVDFALAVAPHWPEPHPVWGVIGEEAKKLGLEWGGDWKTIKDKPHVQVRITLAAAKALYGKDGKEGLRASVNKSLSGNSQTDLV